MVGLYIGFLIIGLIVEWEVLSISSKLSDILFILRQERKDGEG